MDLSIRVAFSAIDKLTRPVSAASKAIGGLSDSLKKTQSSIKDLEKSASSFDKLRAQANDTAQKLRSTQRAFDGLNQKQREGGQLTEAQTARLETLRNKLSRLTDTYNKQTTQLRAAGQAVRQHGVNLNAGSGAVQAAIRRTEQYSQALERERQRLAAVTRAQASYERAKETGAKLRGGGTMAATGAVAAGYAGGSFLAPAVSFDTDMSRVMALTRMDKGDSRFIDLREQAKKLGAETAFSSSDAAQGQAFLAMAGFTPEAIKAALPGVLDAAIAGGALSGDISLGETADISASILNQFQLNAGDMDRVGDVLVGTFTRSSTSLRDLGETMKYTGPVAAGLGISLEKTAAMIGILASNGKRGSDAGTAIAASLTNLAAPSTAAQKALKELGVSVSTSAGKMRPIEDVLRDLYGSLKKYGQVDQVSFLKDIAGQEALVGLQALVRSAGEGGLQKLIAELRKVQGESAATAKKMSDNLGGDLSNLSSAWEGVRIQVEETTDGPLRSLVQWLDETISRVTVWVKANPKLAQTLLLVAGGALALTVAVGALSLAVGILIGPLAKLQLGFAVLTGGRGILGTIAAFRTLGTATGPVMASMRGWPVVITGIASGFGRISAIMPAIRAGLMGAFLAPGAALTSLGKNLAMLMLRLTGLPALWGMITGAVSVLGGALSFLLSPIGLIGAAFVAAGLLIWRYWEPLKAFFTGLFTGVMQALSPLRGAFAAFSPILESVSDGVRSVWQWFTNLLSPIQASKDTLDKCASAGSTFGNVLGGALQVVLIPARALLDTLAWILEKLGVLPDEVERARKKIEDAQRMSLLQDKVAFLQGDMSKVAPKKTDLPVIAGSPPPSSPLSGDNGTLRRLNNIADNTKATANNTKKIGPGDIVFKNLPRALALRGPYQEARVIPQPVPRVSAAAAGGILSVPTATQGATSAPVAASSGAAPFFQLVFNDVGKRSDQELEKMVRNAVRDAMASTRKTNRGSFRDRE
ncbi:phage tail tape measure protein [Klebsiella quasipneumoniae subsp. similipneumoniae]|uniref:Phage tail tape measure protein n=1 Tax=Klebsiella quasipneumoniae subsp. similipneumoniae TaxID=1463164 RepID=A0AAE4MW56_9ENTR|nr:phage tail tape measure protein [Klebsiella quasipneumoniae]HCT2145970.1 phage tail tape measure protein [Raoultella ornithinolytica]MDV0614072.1 phage tail tape measure protein [Klebsiella quasipneumoniae subsp. similipneumoniae]MDV0641812.1 phage tail tape measure protein [Klebsiella quasipneumoniae subsp. similipneumoniae]MDV0728935.1 phage tail tape measure protein [Klebsiella quasipneumoniae subsp. similipneumoniae]MDV0740363.1 phage tail tape measure protein [Klebsiella quasipneumonia